MISAENITVKFTPRGADFFSIKKKIIKSFLKNRIDDSANDKLKYAINDASFVLSNGDRVAVFGKNGSGKSTLLRLLAGIYEPTSGALRVEGSVSALIDSSFGLELDATGYENIFYRLLLSGYSKKKIEKSVDSIVKFAELSDVIHNPIRSYSSGMQMRLSFAIATEIVSDILIIDEWLSVGDSAFNKKAQARMNSIISNSRVLVLASHSKQLLAEICNRFFYMDNGSIKEVTREEFNYYDF
jgi:lipopolysaccharide transport system ATP-binding protein